MVSVVFMDILVEKFENPGWYSWNPTKKNWNFSGSPLGPRASASARRSFNFFFRVSWIAPKVFNFCCQNIREYPWNDQKNQWNPGRKIKKICVVYIEILLWWYFAQEYSYYNLNVQDLRKHYSCAHLMFRQLDILIAEINLRNLISDISISGCKNWFSSLRGFFSVFRSLKCCET